MTTIKKMSALFIFLFSICLIPAQLEAQNLKIEDVKEGMFEQDKVLLFLNSIQVTIDKGVSLEQAVSGLGDISKDANLEVAFLVMKKYLEEKDSLNRSNDLMEASCDLSGNVESVANSSATLRWKRNWCFAGLASWAAHDHNCNPLGGSAWACCWCYTNECN